MSKRSSLIGSIAVALAAAQDGRAPEWVQLFPLGEVKPKDGRAPWKLLNPAAVIAASALGNEGLPIDYDHGAERPATESLNSRAAGWIKQLAARGPDGQTGLWGRVEWTPAGGKAVADKEYRFISPSFMHDANTGEIKRVLRAGLTNTPALDLPALASIQQLEEGSSVDELLSKLRSALNLPDNASADDVVQAITAMRSSNSQLCTAAGVTTLGTTELTAICAKLKSTASATTLQTQVDELQKTVATLTAKAAGSTATQEVEKAIAAGKITPAQKDWAVDYASRNPEGFTTFIKNQPTIVSGRIVEGQPAAGELSPDEKAICAQLGTKEDDYKAEKARLAAKGAH